MGFVVTLAIAGLLLGAVGRTMHPGRDKAGMLVSVAIGVVGMVVVGVIANAALPRVWAVVVAAAVTLAAIAAWARATAGRVAR